MAFDSVTAINKNMKLHTAFTAISIFVLLVFATPVKAKKWVLADGPWSGRINLFAELGDGNLFCSSANRVFWSDNRGADWQEYFINNYINQTVSAFGFFDDGLMFIGAGEILFRSTDFGKTWETIDSLSLDNYRTFVRISSDSLLAGTERNLLVSGDKGITWDFVESWKLGAANLFKTQKRYFIKSFAGLYESFNFIDWKKTVMGDGNEINGVTINYGDTILVYQPDMQKLFYTTNGGDLWLFRALLLPGELTGTPFLTRYGYQFVNIKNQGIYKSAFNSLQWEKADSSLPVIPASAKLFEDHSGLLYLADGIRMYRSSDLGNSWELIGRGINSLQINSIDFIDNELIAGTNKNGFYKTKSFGKEWASTGFLLDDIDVISFTVKPPNTIYAGSHHHGCFKSTDGGLSWEQFNDGLLEHTSYPNIYSLFVAPNGRVFAGSIGLFVEEDNKWVRIENEDLNRIDIFDITMSDEGNLIVGTDFGIYITEDNGKTWSKMGLNNMLITDILLHGNDMYVGTWSYEGVFFSSDKGKTWISNNTGLPDFTMVRGIIADKDDRIFVATLNRGVYYTTNKGQNWNEINTGLPIQDMGAIAVSPEGTIYCGTRGYGLFYLDETVSVDFNIISSDENLLYPNPASDYIHIHSSLKSLEIFDIYGNVTHLKNTNGILDISELINGIYFIKLDNKFKSFIKFKDY